MSEFSWPADKFNPDNFLPSTVRAIKELVLGQMIEFGEEDIYDVQMSYPSVDHLRQMVPFHKTLIHFEVDEPATMFYGLGENITSVEYNTPAVTITQSEVSEKSLTFDVGIWASPESGGPSARLDARQILDKIFSGPYARKVCMEATDGVELLEFSGGRFISDTINDLPVFRAVDMTLRVRVFARRILAAIPYIEVVNLDPGLVIDGSVTVSDP